MLAVGDEVDDQRHDQHRQQQGAVTANLIGQPGGDSAADEIPDSAALQAASQQQNAGADQQHIGNRRVGAQRIEHVLRQQGRRPGQQQAHRLAHAELSPGPVGDQRHQCAHQHEGQQGRRDRLAEESHRHRREDAGQRHPVIFRVDQIIWRVVVLPDVVDGVAFAIGQEAAHIVIVVWVADAGMLDEGQQQQTQRQRPQADQQQFVISLHDHDILLEGKEAVDINLTPRPPLHTWRGRAKLFTTIFEVPSPSMERGFRGEVNRRLTPTTTASFCVIIIRRL